MNTNVNIPVLENDVDLDDPITINSIVSQPTNGTAGIRPEGTIIFKPANDFVGEDTFTYKICDPSIEVQSGISDPDSLCDEATVSVTVERPPNDPPVANDDFVTISEGMNPPGLTIPVLANDNDPDGDELNVIDVSEPEHGIVEISPDGDGVVYTPEEGYIGEDTFDYIICDTNACDNAVVTVTIDPSNTDPIVLDDRVDTPEGEPLVIDVLNNDLPDNLEVTEVTSLSNGTCEITDDGQVEYTPNEGFYGQDNCTYTACIEDTTDCGEGSIIVDVIETPKQSPLAVDDPVNTNEDEPVTLKPLDNDQNPIDSPLNLANVTDAANGTCVANEEDNTVTYTPNTGFVGIDICLYSVCDDNELCDEGAIIISVDETNLPPDANDDQVSTPFNTPVTVPVLENDVDPDEDELTVTEVTQGLHGKCSITEDNQVMYEPNDDYVGPDICPYVVCDSSNECDTANVFVEVESGPPTANEDQVETTPNTPITVDVIDNDTHPEDLPIEVTDIVEQPDNGTCEVVEGQVEYTPNEGFLGSDSCEYTACVEGTEICDSAELTINVVQPAPVASDDKERVPLNTPVLSDVIDNDVNPSTNKPLEVTDITVQPENGVCEVVDNQVKYTPNEDFIASGESCEYIVCIQGTEACDTAMLVVDVVEVKIAQDDKVETPQDNPIIVDVIDNDSYSDDPELPLMVVNVTQPTNGTCEFTTDGQVEYTPDQSFSGSDECAYTVCLEDNTDTCDEGVVIIEVTPKPVSEDDEIETPANTPVLIDVLDNDQPNDTPLEVVTTTQPDNGLCEVVGDQVQYTPDTNFIGTDTCEYIVCVEGSQELCDEATVTVNVTPTKPIAVDDQVETQSDTPVTVDVLENDSHPQDQPLSVKDIAAQPENGVCELIDGQVQYTPNQGFVGSDECDYTVCVDVKARLHRCGIACQVQASIAKFSISIGETEMTTMDGELDSSQLECDEATLIVDVIPTAPTGNDDTSETTPNTPVSIDVLDNDLHQQDLPLVVTDIGNQPENGVCEVVDNQVLYTPNEDFITGIDSCSYIVCIEDTEVCDSAVVTVNVVPQKPIATNESAQTQPDTSVLVDVLENDEHDNDLPLKVIDIAEQAENGVCEVVDGQVQYTSAPDFIGTDTCSYIVCVEDTTVCDSAELVVDVIAEPTTSFPTQKPSQQPSQAPSTKPTDGNRDPFANDDFASTLTNTKVVVNVLVNDFDSDRNDELSVVSTTEPVNGRVEINTDNTITYYPNTGFAGEDSFKYTISDGNGGSDEATVIISIIMPTPVVSVPVVSTLTSSPTNQPSDKPVTSSPSKQPSSKPVSESPTARPTARPTHSLPAIVPSCLDMCFEPLDPNECPSCDPVILPSCSIITLEIGDLCESDGECGLEDQLNNCEGTFDVYRRVPCDSPQEVQQAPDNVCRPRERETVTISASNDAYVVADNDKGYNTDSIVIAEEPQTDGIIKFELPDDICECVTIKKVTLRLYVTNPSRLGGFVHIMNPSWEESSISWSNTPESSGPPLVQIGEAVNESWVEADVTGLVSNSDEHVAVRIQACLKNQVAYASQEYMQGQYAPRLVIELGPSPVGMQMIAGRFQMQQLSHYGRQLGRGTTKITTHSGDTDSLDEDVSIMKDIPICPYPNHNVDLSTVISSYATDDATIMYQDQDSNSLGDDVLLEVSPFECGGDMHAMLKFDLSSLGSSSSVEYASILIHVIEGSSLNGAVFLHAPTPDWSEDSISWKTAPEYTEVVASLSTLQNGMVSLLDVYDASHL